MVRVIEYRLISKSTIAFACFGADLRPAMQGCQRPAMIKHELGGISQISNRGDLHKFKLCAARERDIQCQSPCEVYPVPTRKVAFWDGRLYFGVDVKGT